jgi:hypothetical protein
MITDTLFQTDECDTVLNSPPDHVQIQTVTGCNAACIFCPNARTRRLVPLGRSMNWDLFRFVVDQCLALKVRRYSLYLMNEPLLDRDLPERIAYITSRQKKTQYTKVTTHGGLLTESMAKGMLDSGLDKLKISIQSLNPKRYWTIMRLPLNRMLKNVDRFLKLKEQGGYVKPKLEIVTVDSIYNHDEIFDIRQYWEQRGIPIYIESVENRANHQSIRNAAVGCKPLQAFNWCRRLMEQIYVLYDGLMVQCCADWDQRSIMGDLTRQSLAHIWYGRRYSEYRRQFAAGDLRGMICASCFKQPRQMPPAVRWGADQRRVLPSKA